MRRVDRLRLRLRSLFRRDRVERELDEELRFHLEELTRQHEERGLPLDQARAEARRRFGGIAQLQEGCRDERRTRWIEDVASDIRYAVRLWGKSPGFTTVALLSLALGIGANTATFTLLETVILRELPVREPGALVQIVGVIPSEGNSQGSFSYPSFRWLREHAAMFSHLFTWDSQQIETGAGEGMAWITVDRVSEDYFAGLGVVPILGRPLGDERQQPAVAVLSYDWWHTRFNADPGVLGRTIRLGGVPFTIVGVTPEGFFGPVVGSSPDVFIPLASEQLLNPNSDVLSSRTTVWLPLMARLRPGVALREAAAGLQPLWSAMLQETGPPNRNVTSWFFELKSQVQSASTGISPLRGEFRRPLGVLVVVVAVVLLIACVNLSNLLLARSLTRQREIALRVAVGANRGRLLRQMLTESLLLAATGATLGLLFGLWSSRLLASLLSTSRDTISLDISLNLTVLAYTTSVTLLATLLFGLAPARRALGASVHRWLKEGTQRAIGTRISSPPLLVVQVALSLLLVAGAALFLRTFQHLLSVDLGFDAHRVLIASVNPGRVGLKGEAADQFSRDLQARLQVLPGVESASLSSMTPIQNCCWGETMVVEGDTPTPDVRTDGFVFLNAVAPGFFRTMGTRLLRGRDFDTHDAFNARPVAIVNESFAKKFFSNGEALGRNISLPPNYEVGPIEIVGIVEDARYGDLRGPTRLAAYFPLASREAPSSVEVLVRTPGPPLALAAAVRQQVHAFHPAMPIRFRSLAQEVDTVLTYERLLAWLSAFFGGVAVTLVAIGLYGVLAYSVARRTAEIGLRVALGASRASVAWLVVRQSLMQVIVGLMMGCAAAAYLSRFVQSLLFKVQPTDPAMFATAVAVLGAVAVLAAWWPARRAAAVDPVRALRYE